MTIMKKMNKVIVAMMIMAITAIPAMAGGNVDKNTRPDKKEMRMTDHKRNKKVSNHKDCHMPTIEVFSFKVSQRAARHKNVVAAAKAVHGVKEVKLNRHNGMMTVTYDAKKTTPQRIKAAVN
jgi:hypothetical protein